MKSGFAATRGNAFDGNDAIYSMLFLGTANEISDLGNTLKTHRTTVNGLC